MLDTRMIERLRELDLEDNVIALINYMYDNGDISEEEIFDIGDDEEFDIDNIGTYELGEQYDTYDDALGTNISCNGEDWYVFDNYDDAEAAAKEECMLLFDDIGIEGINFDNLGGIERYVDEDWFKDALEESFRFYCEDIANEGDNTYDNRLVQECYDEGLITDSDFEEDEDGEPDYTQCLVDEEDLVDRYVDNYVSGIYDPIQTYIDNFGAYDFDNVVKNNPNLIDLDSLANDIVEADGVANSLARYDGEEIETDFDDITYYMYRNN